MQIVFLGLSITSSWGNGHATTYRSLLRAVNRRGHKVTFLERDVPWYAQNRDLPQPDFADTVLYSDTGSLYHNHEAQVAKADAVIVGSYVPDGPAVIDWVIQTARGITAFYDIDTPVTLAKLTRHDHEYLHPASIPAFDLYLSFTGGRSLDELEHVWGAQCALPLYCSADPEFYYPEDIPKQWDLGYLGTYSPDRQPALEELLLRPAELLPGNYVVAGPQYPIAEWPERVEHIQHLPPAAHRRFYNAQRFTLNLTRADMKRLGHAPSVRLFEAAACGTPIISDWWYGLDSFFTPGQEILIARTTEDMRSFLSGVPEQQRRAIGQAGRRRVLREHTAAHRASELEQHLRAAQARRRRAAAIEKQG